MNTKQAAQNEKKFVENLKDQRVKPIVNCYLVILSC